MERTLQDIYGGCEEVQLLRLGLSDADLELLAEALKGSFVTELSLAHNQGNFTEQGLTHLANSFRESSLKTLRVVHNKIEDQGLLALAKGLQGSELEELHLHNNGTTGKGVQFFAAMLQSSALQVVNLDENQLGDEGARALGVGLQGSAVAKLRLCRNRITAWGAQYLAGSLMHSQVTSLNLRSNEIKDAGAKHLACALPKCPLTTLLVQENDIGTPGLLALAKVLKSSSLTTFGFSCQVLHLQDTDIAALLDGLKGSEVTDACHAFQYAGATCGNISEFYSKIQEVLKSNGRRPLLLQMQVETADEGFSLTFRTAAGNVAAALTWTKDQPTKDLPEAVVTQMQVSGFHVQAHKEQLRLIAPAGAVLDVGPDAAPLAQQLGL